MLVARPSSEMRRDFRVRGFFRGQLHEVPPATPIAVLEKAEESDILARWYLHEGGHPIFWNVPIEGLPGFTRGPMLIATSRFDLTGVQEQITRQMGFPPERADKLAVPHQVGYEVLYYAGQ
jgi:hypothetical protein